MQQPNTRRTMPKGAAPAPQPAKSDQPAAPAPQMTKPAPSLILVLVGLVPAAAAIVAGQNLRGGDYLSLPKHPVGLMIGAAFVIVATTVVRAGKLGAMLRDTRKALRGVPSTANLIDRIVKYCSVLRVEGPNALQAQIGKE